MTYTAEQIEAIGGSRWTKGDKDRVYLNADAWMPMIGLDIDYYRSGNICAATLNGEAISNRRAGQLSTVKVYWEHGDIHTDLRRVAGSARQDGDALLRQLLAGIASAVARNA